MAVYDHSDCFWQGRRVPRNSARPQQAAADLTGMEANKQ